MSRRRKKWDAGDGSTLRATARRKPKMRASKRKKVKILTDNSTKILKLTFGKGSGLWDQCGVVQRH